MDIIESGRVVAVEETGVWVETIRSSACGSCAARSGCGHRTLAGVLTSDKGLVRARESDQLKAAACSINDRVEIAIRGSTLTRGALLLYGGPLALGVAFAMSQANGSDLHVAVAFFGFDGWLRQPSLAGCERKAGRYRALAGAAFGE